MKDKVGASVRKCAEQLNLSDDYKKREKSVAPMTVQRYVKSTDWGKNAYKLKVKPLLSHKNVDDRLTFALEVQKD